MTFRYPDGTENVLEHFSLDIPAGTTVAIVGETGAGKSTLVNLACRFFEPTAGRILIDGRDYRERSMLWLHSSIGYVLQTPHLFSGSVRENIRYGKLDATDAEVEAAAKLVSAHDCIMRMDKGYDSDVGEGGDQLSTGEKQLISFARADTFNAFREFLRHSLYVWLGFFLHTLHGKGLHFFDVRFQLFLRVIKICLIQSRLQSIGHRKHRRKIQPAGNHPTGNRDNLGNPFGNRGFGHLNADRLRNLLDNRIPDRLGQSFLGQLFQRGFGNLCRQDTHTRHRAGNAEHHTAIHNQLGLDPLIIHRVVRPQILRAIQIRQFLCQAKRHTEELQNIGRNCRCHGQPAWNSCHKRCGGRLAGPLKNQTFRHGQKSFSWNACCDRPQFHHILYRHISVGEGFR